VRKTGKKMRIMLTGDSLTHGFNTGVLLSEFNIINKGIYGDNTEGIKNRIGKDIIEHKPDFLFILIGINDFALGRSIENIEVSYREIVKKAKDFLAGEKIYITKLLPTKNIENRPNSAIRLMNERLSILAEEEKVKIFDLYSQFADETGNLKDDFTDDGLHLTPKAYGVWSSILRSKLEALISNN